MAEVCYKCFPFLYKKCPEGNYHSVFDEIVLLPFATIFQWSGNGGILDLKTGKEYIQAFQYTQIVNKYNRLCEAARKPTVIWRKENIERLPRLGQT